MVGLLGLLLSNAKKESSPCHVGIHWKAFAEHYHMGTHLPQVSIISQLFCHHVMLT